MLLVGLGMFGRGSLMSTSFETPGMGPLVAASVLKLAVVWAAFIERSENWAERAVRLLAWMSDVLA